MISLYLRYFIYYIYKVMLLHLRNLLILQYELKVLQYLQPFYSYSLNMYFSYWSKITKTQSIFDERIQTF